MIQLNVRELIETLEQFPMTMPVVENGCEITDVVIRDELYFSEDHEYKEGQIIKIY